MRTNKSLLKRILEILEQYPNLELCYIKTGKDDRTDITFLATDLTEEQVIYLRTRLHTYETRFVSMDYPTSRTIKIEMIDVVI